MSDACNQMIRPLIELACDFDMVGTSQIQQDSLTARGAGELDELKLRVQQLPISQGEIIRVQSIVDTGIGALNNRIDIGVRDINTGGKPFLERKEILAVMTRNLRDIRHDMVSRLYDVALESAVVCDRAER